ncbi:hypothetical protein Poly51_48590 [Rubripirellula tenax]|uniref:Uncharacterized protein n=1 Tax=Rubripirellula tenax TaxID=2528015 RepID=A0A5C6EKF8_9BACT|nr:hypothetical protein Poly51_48590 [Rubripirellula tenax]
MTSRSAYRALSRPASKLQRFRKRVDRRRSVRHCCWSRCITRACRARRVFDQFTERFVKRFGPVRLRHIRFTIDVTNVASQLQGLVPITAVISGDGQTTCKQTRKRTTRPPLHHMVLSSSLFRDQRLQFFQVCKDISCACLYVCVRIACELLNGWDRILGVSSDQVECIDRHQSSAHVV